MLLSSTQQDALSELINIGFGRAASALSILAGQRVLLDAPSVEVYRLTDLGGALQILSNREMTTIHQVFSGKLSGDIMLLLDTKSAAELVALLEGRIREDHTLTESDREGLAEAGNILLNAFIGSFGNLLNVHITFTVPNLRLESIREMLTTLTIDKREVEYALVVRIHFRLAQGDVNGFVVIIMGIESLEALFEAMKSEGYLI